MLFCAVRATFPRLNSFHSWPMGLLPWPEGRGGQGSPQSPFPGRAGLYPCSSPFRKARGTLVGAGERPAAQHWLTKRKHLLLLRVSKVLREEPR